MTTTQPVAVFVGAHDSITRPILNALMNAKQYTVIDIDKVTSIADFGFRVALADPQVLLINIDAFLELDPDGSLLIGAWRAAERQANRPPIPAVAIALSTGGASERSSEKFWSMGYMRWFWADSAPSTIIEAVGSLL